VPVFCSQAELKEEIPLAKAEAMSAFGNDTLLIEKFVEQARHIEFQVVGDQFGHLVYLPERDCSVQRRNQKVLSGRKRRRCPDCSCINCICIEEATLELHSTVLLLDCNVVCGLPLSHQLRLV
jgi:hypothetical protein